MKFTGEFEDSAQMLLNVWRRQRETGRTDPKALSASILRNLRANMILTMTDTTSENPMNFHVTFLHRYTIPSAILKVVADVQRDQKFSEFKDQEYLQSAVIGPYQKTALEQNPLIDTVLTKIMGFKVLYDRVVVPHINAAGRSNWVMSLTETRFVLPVPEKDPGIDPEDVRILQLLREGETAKEIAVYSGNSPRTIEHRIERLKKRFGAKNIPHLVSLSISHAYETANCF